MEKGGLSGGLEEGKALEDSSEERSESNSKESSGGNAGESSGTVVFGDEMRLGLIGQVRRRWAPRGMKIRQPVELTYEWAYLNLAVDPIEGTLRWEWTSDMKAESIAPVLAD